MFTDEYHSSLHNLRPTWQRALHTAAWDANPPITITAAAAAAVASYHHIPHTYHPRTGPRRTSLRRL